MNTVLMDAAEQWLRVLGAGTRDDARRLLPYWHTSTGLTVSEREEVVARFDTEFWPASIHHHPVGGAA